MGFLTLTRKKNECICIGSDIKIYFTRLNEKQCSVSIQAPKELPIHRKEIFDRLELKGELRSFAKGEA